MKGLICAGGELEITDVNNSYIKDRAMSYVTIQGEWTDAGTVESLYAASTIIKNRHDNR